MEHTYKGITYEVRENIIYFTYEGIEYTLPAEYGKRASLTMYSFVCHLRKEQTKPVLITYTNNSFGDYWKNCWAGEFKVVKIEEELYLKVRFNFVELTIECYKHPFHLAADILRGVDRVIWERFEQILSFQHDNLKAGIDYKISPKGVYLIR